MTMPTRRTPARPARSKSRTRPTPPRPARSLSRVRPGEEGQSHKKMLRTPPPIAPDAPAHATRSKAHLYNEGQDYDQITGQAHKRMARTPPDARPQRTFGQRMAEITRSFGAALDPQGDGEREDTQQGDSKQKRGRRKARQISARAATRSPPPLEHAEGATHARPRRAAAEVARTRWTEGGGGVHTQADADERGHRGYKS